MAKLAPMLDRLARHDDAATKAGESPARLVLASGKRSRVEGDGDFETISSAALGEDDVRDLLLQSGVGSRLDGIGTRPLPWTFRHEGSTFRAEAVIQGRELRATIVRVRPEATAAPAPPPRRRTTGSRGREARHDPPPVGGATEEVTRRYDPRSDEEPPRERRRRPEIGVEPASPVDRSGPRAGTATVQADEVARALAAELIARSTPIPPAFPPLTPADAAPRRETPPAPGPPTTASATSDVDAWRDVVATATRGGSPFEVPIGDRTTPDAFDDVHDRPTFEPSQPLPPPMFDLDDVADRIASRRASLPPVFGFDDPASRAAPRSVRPPPAAPLSERPRVRSSLPAMELPTSTPPPAPSERVVIGQRLVRLIEQARRAGASDLHLAEGRPAVARIGGAMAPAGEPIDGRVLADLLLPALTSAQRAALERDGSVWFAAEAGDGDTPPRCRFAISRQRTGLKASIRLLLGTLPTVADLELPEALVSATRHRQGLVLITSPAGHGKSTTLAALLDHLNATTSLHVVTVEAPIEYLHPRKKAMVSQREVGTHTRSLGVALRSALRQDADVLVVALRDVETARAALAASETGHLVLATLDTPSAARAIDRLIDLFPAPEQPQVRATLASSLRLAASQRLVPRREGGGRVAAVEMLPASAALSALIRDARTMQIPALLRGGAAGAVRLDEALADLVRRGVIDRKEAAAHAEDPQELATSLDGRSAEGKPTEAAASAAPKARPPTAARAPGEGEDRGTGRALWQRAADMFRRGGG